MGFNLGYFAGALGDIFLEDNERVSKATDSTLDALANLVIKENDKRTEKVEAAKESISRLEALGFQRAVAASIARGGIYAVNDAVKNAGTAKEYGEDVNSYYKATATFKPEDYADYTVAEMAEAVVPAMDVSKSADILTKGKRINTTRVNEAVAKYKGYTPKGSGINVPIFAQDVSKMGGGKISIENQNAASLRWRRDITDLAQMAGKDKSGLSLGVDASGNRTYMVDNPSTYGTWVRSKIPQLLEEQKKLLPKKQFEAYQAHVNKVLRATEPATEDDSGSGKAKLRGADAPDTNIPQVPNVDTNILKNTIKEDIAKNISYEQMKREATADGIDPFLFDQIYMEVTGQGNLLGAGQ
jgi:hypothetical protein